MNRRFISQGLLACALAAATLAFPQSFPTRPIRVIVPFPAGGTMDSVVRPLGQEMAKVLGQPFVIENKPGASTVVGVVAAAKSAPDGYTVVGIANSFTLNATLQADLPYDTIKDFRPIGFMARTPAVLVGNPRLPAKDLRELIAYSKANPGKLSYATPGTGTGQHLAGEMLKMTSGIDMVHVPYKGVGPALNDLLGGQIDLVFGNLPDLLPQIRAGKAKSFGVASLQRATLAPDLPTIAEQGYPGFEASTWMGLMAPAGVSDQVVARLHGELVRALAIPEIRSSLEARGLEPMAGTPEEFGAFIKSEIAKNARVIKEANIKLD